MTDWEVVHDAKSILADSQRLLHLFSSEMRPSLWHVLPALEELQSVWENKAKDRHFKWFRQALHDGLSKIGKYYNQLDAKPAFVLALVLHPYYKLAYIKMAWGGPEEQAAEKASGNEDVKDWHDEASKIVEWAMEVYWHKRQIGPNQQEDAPVSDGDDLSHKSVFDRLQQTLITCDGDDGWAPELQRYLKDMPADVTRETDILEWWSVSGAACACVVPFIYCCIGEPKALPNVGTHCP